MSKTRLEAFSDGVIAILQNAIIRHDSPESKLKRAVGSDFKGKISMVAYIAAIPLAFVHQAIADVLYVGVALLWLVPDRRIARNLNHH